MNRRILLKLLGGAGATVLFSKPIAFGQALNWQQLIFSPSLTPQGLPRDWQMVVPPGWPAIERQINAVAAQSRADIGRDVMVAGASISSSGEIQLDGTEPVGKSVSLPASLTDIVSDPDSSLDLSVLNRDYNPFMTEPIDADAVPIVGALKAPSEIFQGKLFIPVRYLMAKLLQQTGALPESQALLAAIKDTIVIRTPAHQFKLDNDRPGNRIVFYNDSDLGYRDIDKLTFELSKMHLRLVKQMVHFNIAAQGGPPDFLVKDGVGGATHAGGLSLGYNAEEKPTSVKSDWPSNYGRLSEQAYVNYNAHLFAIDYAKGTQEPIPEAALAAYSNNADMWDCCAALLVPFASNDPNPAWRDYTYNPLEVFDQASARGVAAALAQFDGEKFLMEHGAFYCAEGQYVVANLGPQEDARGGTLLKESKYGATPFGLRIANFQKAPAYSRMTPEQRRRRPDLGWNHLKQLGPQNGGISEAQYGVLKETDRTGVFLDWIPESVKGWQTYRPIDADGLIARPMTVATIVWSLFRRYMPRQRVAKALAGEITRAYQAGDDRVKRSIVTLIGGEDPLSASGKTLLAGIGMKAATGLLLGLLESDEVRATLLRQAGFGELTQDEDKTNVLRAYSEFLAILKNADYSTEESLDRALAAADQTLAKLSVTRNFYNPVTQRETPQKSTLMKYAAPASFGVWAQYPVMAGTGCVRYVATALHTEQRRPRV